MRFHLHLFIVSLLLTQFGWAEQSVTPVSMPEILPADVRLLIDVSGSMKQNDPQNLRKPAMELLVKLLPDESRAGVWTFGKEVNLLVPHREVNDKWRAEAAGKTSGINSVALFTHIGAALEMAAYDSGSDDKRFRNNIILLTDGVVDIETSAEVNAVERQRIVDELLPRLQQSGYIVHTIALSDDADTGLMEQLSKATDGVFATAKNAEELMSTFLRIFDQAVPLERLPLQNNRFLVDAGVEEFTALIFRKPGAQPTELLSPDEKKFTAANALGKVRWHTTANYDLITVESPLPGEWQINAEIDPDNRVTVVSNLKLLVAPLKNNIEVSQPLPLHFTFSNEGETVVDPQFLQLLDLDVTIQRNRDGKQWQLPLVNTVPPIDGVYQHPLELFRETGNYSIQLLVDGKTFKREFKHQVTVGSPFTVKMEKVLADDRVSYRILVSADDQRVVAGKTAIVARIKDSTGGSALRNFALNENNEWELLISPKVPARYSVGLQVSGVRTNGEPVKETLATQYYSYPETGDPINPPDDPIVLQDDPIAPQDEKLLVADIPPHVDEPAAAADEEAVEAAQPVATSAPATGGKKWLMYSSIGLANLLVLGLAFFAYRLIAGKKAKAENAELEEILDVDVQKIAEGKRPAPAMQEVGEGGVNAIDVSAEDDGAEIDLNPGDSGDNGFDDFLADLDSPAEPGNTDEDDGESKK